jgi:hypothetical protein
MSRKAATPEELAAQLRRTEQVRRIVAQPLVMSATSFCDAPLAQTPAGRAAEVGKWLDAVDDRTRRQQPKTGGPKPPHADRFPEWAPRVAAGEHITDIIRAAFPELDATGVEKVRKSFEHAQRTQQGDIPPRKTVKFRSGTLP